MEEKEVLGVLYPFGYVWLMDLEIESSSFCVRLRSQCNWLDLNIREWVGDRPVFDLSCYKPSIEQILQGLKRDYEYYKRV